MEHPFVPMTGTYRIKNESNIGLELELAGLSRRLGALLLDILIVDLLISPIDLVLYFLFFSTAANQQNLVSLSFYDLAVAGVGFFFLIAYFVVGEGLYHGTTVGKRLFGIRVVRGNGGALNMLVALVRNVVLPIDMATVGGISMIFDRSQRRFGDLLAGTVVVRLPHIAPVGVGRDAPIIIPSLMSPPPPGIDPSLLSSQTKSLILDYLHRNELSPDARMAVAARIADRMRREASFSADDPIMTIPAPVLIYGTYLMGVS